VTQVLARRSARLPCSSLRPGPECRVSYLCAEWKSFPDRDFSLFCLRWRPTWFAGLGSVLGDGGSPQRFQRHGNVEHRGTAGRIHLHAPPGHALGNALPAERQLPSTAPGAYSSPTLTATGGRRRTWRECSSLCRGFPSHPAAAEPPHRAGGSSGAQSTSPWFPSGLLPDRKLSPHPSPPHRA